MQLTLKFKITDLGSTSHYLSMEVFWGYNTITITQIVYIDQILDTY